MHSLRAKLLVSFCLAEVLIVAAIIGVVTTQLRQNAATQDRFVEQTMESRAREELRGHLRLLQLLLEKDQQDCVRAADLLSGNAEAIVSVVSGQHKHLEQFLKAVSGTAKLDLFLLYDLQGKPIASFPHLIDDLTSAQYFAQWSLGEQVRALAAEDDAWAAGTLAGVVRLEPAFLVAHSLEGRAPGHAALGQVVLQVLVDEFGDPIGFAVAARLLNGYHKPFQQANQVAAYGAALYVGREPVAWAGFGAGAEVPPVLGANLPETPAELGGFWDGELSAAQGNRIATFSPLANLFGEPIATLCATIPVAQVRGAAEQLSAANEAMLERLQLGILLIGAGAVVLFFLTALVIESRLISRPLQPVVEGLHQLALGEADLTRALPVSSRDEVGQLAANFNQFLERMRASVLRSRAGATDIQSGAETIQYSSQQVQAGARDQSENLERAHAAAVAIGEGATSVEARTRSLMSATESSSSATQQMGATAQEIAAKMDELFHLVDQVASSVHQMSAVSGQVSASVESLAATAEETAAAIVEMDHSIGQVRVNAERTGSAAEAAVQEARSGKQAVDATVAGIETLSGMVAESTEVIRALARRSGEIGGILSTISDIAEQTNLLALNASIIAAQAGQHGTGFGVVANEIKTLAASTKTSAREITGIVHGLQQVAQQAVVSTESGRAQVLEEVERAREAGERLDRILHSSEESQGQALEIAGATRDHAEASGQITLAMERVGDMLNQITSAVLDQGEGNRLLTKASDSMRDIAAQVKLGTDEQAVGSSQIAAAMEQVRTMLQEIEAATRAQTGRSQDVLAAVAVALEVARRNAALSAEFDTAVTTLTRQAQDLQQEVNAFKA